MSAICFLIFSNNKITKRTCFLDVGHVLLVSDFNQNRFDRFIFQGDILGSRLASATVKTHSTNVYLIYHSSNLHISEAATANRSQYSDMIFLEMKPSIVKPKSKSESLCPNKPQSQTPHNHPLDKVLLKL